METRGNPFAACQCGISKPALTALGNQKLHAWVCEIGKNFSRWGLDDGADRHGQHKVLTSVSVVKVTLAVATGVGRAVRPVVVFQQRGDVVVRDKGD